MYFVCFLGPSWVCPWVSELTTIVNCNSCSCCLAIRKIHSHFWHGLGPEWDAMGLDHGTFTDYKNVSEASLDIHLFLLRIHWNETFLLQSLAILWMPILGDHWVRELPPIGSTGANLGNSTQNSQPNKNLRIRSPGGPNLSWVCRSLLPIHPSPRIRIAIKLHFVHTHTPNIRFASVIQIHIVYYKYIQVWQTRNRTRMNTHISNSMCIVYHIYIYMYVLL